MKIKKLFTVSILFMFMISGCVSVDPLLKKFESKETRLVRQYIAKGESLEKKALFSDALEQYKLALTIDHKNKNAIQHKRNVLSKLWTTAQVHYKKGLQLDSQGKYEAARKEYLSALQNWPSYKKAKEKLTPGGVINGNRDYIIHILKHGESVSQLAKIYYGDFKKHSIIGKFNILKDVTKVRKGQKLKIPVIAGVSLQDLKKKQKKYLNLRKPAPQVAAKVKPKIKPAVKPDTKPAIIEADIQPEPEPVQAMVFEKPKPEPEHARENTPEQTAPVIMEEPPPVPEKKVSQDYQKGIQLFNKKEYDRAIPLFLAAAKTDPDNKTLRDYLFKSNFQQGLSLFNQKKYLSAKDHFESALTYDKNCEKCPGYIEKCEETYKDKHYNLGIHYFGKEQLKKAIKEWKKVKKIDPDYKEVSPNLKKAEMLSKRLESIKKGSSE